MTEKERESIRMMLNSADANNIAIGIHILSGFDLSENAAHSCVLGTRAAKYFAMVYAQKGTYKAAIQSIAQSLTKYPKTTILSIQTHADQ